MIKILLLNGPNLNLIGTREPDIYGTETLESIVNNLTALGKDLQADLTAQQFNSEGDLIDALHNARFTQNGVILNAGAYTHTSIALRDAVSAIDLPVIEVHLSNVHAREPFRHHSMIAAGCLGVIAGFGARSYDYALRALIDHLNNAS